MGSKVKRAIRLGACGLCVLALGIVGVYLAAMRNRNHDDSDYKIGGPKDEFRQDRPLATPGPNGVQCPPLI